MDRDAVLKQLRKSWLITLGLSPLVAFFTVQVVLLKQSGSFKPNEGILVLGIMGAFFAMLLVISGATIFFNLYFSVRNELNYILFTWYLAPFLLSILMITQSDSADDWDMWMPFLAMALPFFAIHTWFYTRFIKILRRAKIKVGNTAEQTQ